MGTDGPGERRVVLFRPGQYPLGVLGEVRYMLCPPSEDGSRKVWLWVLPAFQQQLVDILTSVFELDDTRVKCDTVEPETQGLELHKTATGDINNDKQKGRQEENDKFEDSEPELKHR